MNPSNLLLQDKRCKGYQYCNNENQCDRMCGEPCFGGIEEAMCNVTGCDTKILCPGSVSCIPNYCDDCKGVYFDMAGSVITDCSGEDVLNPEFGVDAPPAAEEGPVVQPSEPAKEDPVVQPSNPMEEDPVSQPSDPAVGIFNMPAWCSQKPSAAQNCIPECGGNPGGPGCNDVDVDDSTGISSSSFGAIMLVTMMAMVVGPFMVF